MKPQQPVVLPVVLLFAVLAALVSPDVATAQELSQTPLRDFSLQDYRGKQHRLSDYAEANILVLAFLGTECPLVKLYGPRLEEISKKYESRGVVILGMNANRQDSITNIAAYARRHGVTFPILKDVRNVVADEVQAERTPSVVVFDAARRAVYRGRIDDQYGVGYLRNEPQKTYLVDAIEATLRGDAPKVSLTSAAGCLIGRMRKVDPGSSVTYGAHIAPILTRHCVECHRDGEIAPFALTSYDEVAGWADMIREVVQDQRMPPWHADPAHGKFSNARGLSAVEKDLVNQWVLAGAPAGDLSSLPALPAKAEGWQLDSEPDLVVSMNETYRIPAEGVVKYKYFEVDPGFKEDKWIRAAEVVPGSRDVVHHVLLFARSGKSETLAPGAGGGSFLTAYVPGLRTAELPDGMAKLIPAGSKFVFQMHYTPVGVERTDRTSVGLYFVDEKDVREVVVTQETLTHDFAIPPRDGNYKVEATSKKAPVPLKLLAMNPHMHLRGKSFSFEAILPNKERQTLLNVPAYDFNWQTGYRLENPMMLPAGARMHCVAHFDNSESNLNNPDPDATVGWGDQTWNEMMIGYFDVAMPRQRDTDPSIEVLAVMKQFDRDGDGVIQRAEVPAKHVGVFRRLDADADDEVTMDELKRLPALQ